MAYKSTGTAAKSASGASMSKYDVEVEARLKKLEAAVKLLEEHSHPDRNATGDDVSARVAEIEEKLNRHQLR